MFRTLANPWRKYIRIRGVINIHAGQVHDCSFLGWSDKEYTLTPPEWDNSQWQFTLPHNFILITITNKSYGFFSGFLTDYYAVHFSYYIFSTLYVVVFR